ncbi:MAG: WG repeat-containing protein [Eubacteriales bacterium]
MKRVWSWVTAVALVTALGLTSVTGALEEGLLMQETKLPREYFNYYSFQEGMARVVDNKRLVDNYGFVDSTGREVIPCMYAAADDFSEGVAAVKDFSGFYGFIYQDGQLFLPYQYEYARSFQEGMAYVQQGGGKYFINRVGDTVLDVSQYAYVGDFSQGLAPVERDGRQGFIDANGREVVACVYDSVLPYGEDGVALGQLDGVYYGLSVTGQRLFSLQCQQMFPFSDGMAKFQRDGKVGYIDTTGREVIPAIYSTQSLNFSDGLAYVENSAAGLRGYIDRTGQLVLNISEYDKGGSFQNGYALVEKNGKMAYLSAEGQVSDLIYSDGVALVEGRALAQKGSAVYLVQPAAVVQQFSTPDSWAAADIQKAIEQGLVPRQLQSEYRRNITRQEFCELLASMLERQLAMGIETYGEQLGLQPVTYRDTASAEVRWISALGIASGRGEGVFDPQGSITRQEAAVMLANTMKLLGEPEEQAELTAYEDAGEIASWAQAGVEQVVAAGIMTGMTDSQFGPLEPYTRQQAIVTILRLYYWL